VGTPTSLHHILLPYERGQPCRGATPLNVDQHTGCL